MHFVSAADVSIVIVVGFFVMYLHYASAKTFCSVVAINHFVVYKSWNNFRNKIFPVFTDKLPCGYKLEVNRRNLVKRQELLSCMQYSTVSEIYQ